MYFVFWERFYALCISKGTKPNPVAKEIGISSGILTRWKSEDTLPSGETLVKLADYLGCSVDYLLGRDTSEEVIPASAFHISDTTVVEDTKQKSPQELAFSIKEIAKSQKITIKKMLSDCGLSVNTLSSMQSGGYFPRLENIAKIADYLNCSIDYLLGRESTVIQDEQTSDMYITQEIVARIKQQAKEKQILIKDLLSHCKMNLNALSEFAKGKRLSCISLARIADYLDCSVDYLLGRESFGDCISVSAPSINSAVAVQSEQTNGLYTAQELTARIKGRVKEQGVLIRDMLTACGLNINTISQISDKRGLSSFALARIADYLDCSVDYLLGREPFSNSVSAFNTQKHGEEEAEILRILNTIDVKGRTELLSYAFALEEKHKGSA